MEKKKEELKEQGSKRCRTIFFYLLPVLLLVTGGMDEDAPLWLHFRLQVTAGGTSFFPTTGTKWPLALVYKWYSSPVLWMSAWKDVKHLKTLRIEKKSMHVAFTWQPSKVVKAIRTRRPSVCVAVICSWSPRLPTTPWVSCIMQQQFWLKSKNLLTECSVRHLGRCLINYYNWHPHQMSDIWRSLCW